MTQNKTSLILNNLVELNIPTCTDSKYSKVTFEPDFQSTSKSADKPNSRPIDSNIPPLNVLPHDQVSSESTEKGSLCIRLCFPFAFLLQKVQLEESHKDSAKQFNIEMVTKHAVTHGSMQTILSETEIIDFKKEKIDWRFKTRMRSNSNEFLDSPLAMVQKMPKNRPSYFEMQLPGGSDSDIRKRQEHPDSEDISLLSSDEEFELKQEGKITILGNGISNQFSIFISITKDEEDGAKIGTEVQTPSSCDSKNYKKMIEKFRLGFPFIRLFVWPTFRLPTGSSVIALINTSFLFAQKRMEQERLEADFLVALSLISGRKFIQASEKLRKIQSCLLNFSISVRSLLQAMNIEMIIGESMNQHSQISEKMYAFQRAVLFFKLACRIEKQQGGNKMIMSELDQVLATCSKTRLKQEDAYKYLLRLQPHLIDILLLNIDNDVQAVRMASLKTLEFIFDTLGCNLDEQIVQILVAIIKTYPSMSKRSNIPKNGRVISFFEDYWQIGIDKVPVEGQRTPFNSEDHPPANSERESLVNPTSGQRTQLLLSQKLERFQPETLSDLNQYSTFFSLNDLHSLKDCQVKDASLFHQSFIQTSKNFYNHILESLVFLLSSTSTPLLVQIFYEVIQRVLFEERIEADLQVYLLRIADKILQLCQGNLKVDRNFLNTIFDLVLQKNSTTDVTVNPSTQTSNKQGSMQPGGQTVLAESSEIGKVANDLWQTIKTSYLLQQSYDSLASFIQWVVQQLNSLIDKVTSVSTSGSSNKDSCDLTSHEQSRTQAQLRDAFLSLNNQQKLLQLLELSNLLIYGQLRLKKAGKSTQSAKDTNNYKVEKRNLQKITARELENGLSFNEDTFNLHVDGAVGAGPVPDANNYNHRGHSKILPRQASRSPMKLIALEMCKLIEPVIFWLNFSIERPDRINYFKVAWGTLTRLLQVMPRRKDIGVEFNCIRIILPTLQRVENFCRTSSPSQEMLQFLTIVFSDIKQFLLAQSRKYVKKELFAFLKGFITTFVRIIPHNLHDEVFEVCSLLIDIAGSNGQLTQEHVTEILEAMVHKYTMRSKAHKRLSDQFLQKWVLNHSLVQYQEQKNLEFQIVDKNHQQQLQYMQQARVHGQNQLLVQSQTHQIQQFSMSHQTHANCNNSRSEEPPVQAMLHQSTIALSGWVADEVLASQQHHQQQQAPYPDEHSWSEEEEKFATAPAHPSQQDTNQQPQTSHVTNSASMESLQPQQQPQIPLYQPFQPPVMDHSSSIPGNLYSQGQFQKNVQHQVSAECDSTQANEDSSNPNTKAAAILEHQIVSTLDPSNRIQPNSGLYFDTVCEFSLFQNFLASNDQFISVQDHEQLCFEKLQVLQELIEALREEHNFLFKRLLQHADFNHKIKLIFQNETARAKIIKLMKSMTNYFLKYNSPKTFYEHPIVHNSVSMPLGTGPLHNSQPQQQQQHAQTQQQQTSARQFQRNFGADIAAGGHSMLQFGQQLHSEPSLDLLNFMNSQEEDQLGNSANNVIVNANNTNAATVFNSNGANANNLNNNLALTSGELLHTSTQEQIRSGDHADQLNMHGRRMHHYSQHVERQQNFLFNSNQNEDKEVDSPRLVPSNVNMFLYDEINLINSERLILIQIYSILIRTQMEQIQPVNQTERTRLDSQQQLQALNMIDMLLYSLCPTPSFQNMVIRYLLNPESGQVPTSGIAHGDNGNAEFPYQIFQPHRLSFHFAGLNSMLGSQMGMSSYEVLNDTIPDFETMHICDQQLGSLREAQTSPIEPNSFPREFECWDIRYQHSRLALVFKFWPFVENAMLSSSWNNVRAACYSVLSKAMLIPDVIQMSTNYQKRLKELLFPLLNKLLKSKECEGRAAGLNILGSLCGLSSFQTPSYRQSFEFSRGDDSSAAVNAADISNSHHGYGDVVFDCDQGQDYHYDRYEQRQREALGRNQIKIREHLHIFRRNSSFVSLAIWQEVFDMQEDWNEDIAKAAEVLTQLCAPKDSVKHFKKMSREKYQLRLCEVQNQLKQAYSSGSRKAFGQMSSQFAMQHLGFIGGSHAASLQSTGRSQINSRSELNGKQKHDKLVSKQTSQQQLTIQDRSEKSLIQLNLRQAHSGIISQKQLMSAHAGGTHLMQGGNTLAQTSTSVLFNQDFNMMSESIQATGRVNNGNAVGSGQAAGQQQTLNESSDSQSFEEFSAESEDLTGDELDQQAFYMEHFTERQLQQAVSLFSAEFKPISGLQAEQRFNQIQRKGDNKYRNGLTIGANSTVNSLSNLGGAMNGLGLPIDDEYGDGYGNLKNNILIDFFEDNMLEEVGSIDSFEDDDDKNIGKTTMTVSGTAAGTKDSLGVSSSERQQTTSQSDGDDLGIIDLDKQEGGEYDDFDQLDDEKLPVLKNTYSKKNRPNNSKSVAIGSRSQGDVLRIRSQALKVLKAADEEIKVQIKEHPEMLSSLQRGLSKKNQNPTSLEFQTQERLRYLDDHNLNYKAQAHDVLSSKSESAHRIQHKRRIQSGKWPLGECLSEDRLATERDRHSSHLSKTDSSNASQSTPMEIGDIQIAMRQEAQYRPKKVSAKKRQRQHNMAVDAENPSSDDLNEIRSQDNRKKRHPEKFKYNIGHFATSQKMVVGNLSEYDHSEKMSADDAGNADDEELQDDNELEYEVISAPVRRSKMARAQVLSSTNKLAHQSDKISVDSLTDLSPLADERCSSVMTGNTLIDREEEFTPKNSLDTRFQQRIMPVPTQKNSGMALTSTKLAGDPPANMNQQPQKNSQLISKKHQQQQQSQQMYQQQLIGTSQYLQGLNKQNFASNTCTSMSQPKLHQHGQKLSMNKMQTTQIKMPGRGDTSTKGSSKNQQPTTVSQNQPKMVVPHQRVDLNRGNDVPASSSDQQEVSGQANQTVSQKLVSLQKPVLNNAHSQQAIIQGVQPQKQQAHSGKVAGVKGKGINTDQANSFAPSGTSSAQAQQNQQTRIFREKRPSSLVVGHMPSEKNQQPNATKQNLKRNNFMMQQSPKAATLIGISNRSKPAKNKVISSQKEISMPEGSTRRRSQRTNKQPDIMKHQAAVHEEKKADDEHVIDGKHVPLQAQPETEKFEGFIDDDSDPVEDL